MKKNLFIGRQEALASALLELRQSYQPGGVLSIDGEAGSGKSIFCRELWRGVAGDDCLTLRLSIQPIILSGGSIQRLEGITSSLIGNRIKKDGILKDFQRTAKSDVDVRTDSLSHDINVDAWARHFQEIIAKNEPRGRLLIFLEDYHAYSASQKKWVAFAFIKHLMDLEWNWDIHVIVVGREPLGATVDADLYWGFIKHPIPSISMEPFNENEATAFFQSLNVPIKDIKRALAQTRGLPGALHELASSFTEEEKNTITEEVDAFFKYCTPEQKRWVFWAAHFDSFNESTLSLFATSNKALRAIQWIKAQTVFPFNIDKKWISWDFHWQQAVLQWQKKHEPDTYDGYSRFVENRRLLTREIPQAENFEILSHFSLLGLFSAEELDKYFPQKASQLKQFLNHNANYFIKKKRGWVLKHEFIGVLEQFRKIHPVKNEEKILLDVNNRRKSEEKQLRERIDHIGREINSKKQERDQKRKKLEGVQKQIEEQRRRDLIAEASHSFNPPEHSFALGRQVAVILMIAGGLSLYIGLLFYDNISYVYPVVGILLLVIGFLSWGGKSNRKTSRVLQFASKVTPFLKGRNHEIDMPSATMVVQRDLSRECSNLDRGIERLEGDLNQLLERLEEEF